MSFATKSASSSLRFASSRVQRSPLGQLRHAHDNHGHKHLPFQYSNRRAFAVKNFVFCATGLSIPFIAVTYQLRKSGASAA